MLLNKSVLCLTIIAFVHTSGQGYSPYSDDLLDQKKPPASKSMDSALIQCQFPLRENKNLADMRLPNNLDDMRLPNNLDDMRLPNNLDDMRLPNNKPKRIVSDNELANILQQLLQDTDRKEYFKSSYPYYMVVLSRAPKHVEYIDQYQGSLQ